MRYLWLTLCLLFMLLLAGSLAATLLELEISSSTDDGGHATNTWSTNASLFYMGQFGAHLNYEGYRWQNVTIPQGSTIDDCVMVWSAAATRSDDLTMTFWAEDTSNAATFSDSTDYRSRTKTTASVGVAVTTNWISGTWYRSESDLKSILQEVVNRGDWSSGNAFVILAEDQGSGSNVVQRFSTYDTSPTLACSLIVNYTIGAAATGQVIMVP